MRVSIATAAVIEALEQKQCAFCLLRSRAENAFMASFFREMVMDEKCLAGLSKQGFCSHHFRLVLAFHDKLGTAMALRTIVKAALDDPLKQGPDSCYICGALSPADRQRAEIAGDLFAADAEGHGLLESAMEFFCRPHMTWLLSVNLPRWDGRVAKEFESLCREACLRSLKKLAGELDWFVKKSDYRMVDAPWHGTEDVAERVINKLSGITGLPKALEVCLKTNS